MNAEAALLAYDERTALEDARECLVGLKHIGGGLAYARFDRMIGAIDKVLGTARSITTTPKETL